MTRIGESGWVRAGRRRFEQSFTADRMVEETLGVYEEVCGSFAASKRSAGRAALEREMGQRALAPSEAPSES